MRKTKTHFKVIPQPIPTASLKVRPLGIWVRVPPVTQRKNKVRAEGARAEKQTLGHVQLPHCVSPDKSHSFSGLQLPALQSWAVTPYLQ